MFLPLAPIMHSLIKTMTSSDDQHL